MNLKKYTIKNTGAAKAMKKYALDEWNMHIDINSESWTKGDSDDTYGWEPMPQYVIKKLLAQHY